MNKQYTLLIVLFFLIFLISGCAVAPVSLQSEGSKMEAVTFSTIPDHGSLYIFRTDQMLGSGMMYEIEINGSTVTSLAHKTFAKFDLRPGLYRIIGKAEDISSVEVIIKEGEITYLWQEVNFGNHSPRNKIHLVEENYGRSWIEIADLIEVVQHNIAPL